MRRNTHIRSKCNLYTFFVRHTKSLFYFRTYFKSLWANDFRKIPRLFCLFINKLARRYCRNVIGAILLHEPCGWLIHQCAMFDCANTCSNCSLHSLYPMCMCSNVHFIIVGCLNDRFNFFFRELWVLSIFCNTQYTSSCGDLY